MSYSMQVRISTSKPLTLVVIGLFIGVSLGIGSGYAVFYPEMVRQRDQSNVERLSILEQDFASINEELGLINENINHTNDRLDGLEELENVFSELSNRVSVLENGQVTLSNEFNELEVEIGLLFTKFDEIDDSWNEMIQSVSRLRNEYSSIDNEINNLHGQIKQTYGVQLFTAYMANPSSTFKQRIALDTFNILMEQKPSFKEWVIAYGENTAKILLQQEINKKAGSLVWNPTGVIRNSEGLYQVKLETYFNLEFSPADVTVNNMHLEIEATVNVNTKTVSNPQVNKVELN